MQNRGPVPLTAVSFLRATPRACHDAKPDGWFVGQPMYHERRRAWEQYAFDMREKGKGRAPITGLTGRRGSELEVVRGMARCLGLIGARGIPE